MTREAGLLSLGNEICPVVCGHCDLSSGGMNSPARAVRLARGCAIAAKPLPTGPLGGPRRGVARKVRAQLSEQECPLRTQPDPMKEQDVEGDIGVENLKTGDLAYLCPDTL